MDNAALARVVYDIAQSHDVSTARVALAWLLAHRPWIVPIPGTERMAYLEQERPGALSRALDDEEHAALDALASCVRGSRYGAEVTVQAAVVSPVR